MSDATPPPRPFPTPPSIEAAVKEHLDLVHELHELRTSLASNTVTLARLMGTRTDDRLALGGVERRLDGLEKRFTALEGKVDGLSLNLVKLLQHLGVALG